MKDVSQALGEIHRALIDGSRKLCCAESVTVGRVQSLLAATSGASNYFVGGITAYNLHLKVRHLGVSLAHAASCDCVSERVAKEMAAGALPLFDASLAIAVTGYAEPCEEWDVTEPFAYLAIASTTGAAFSARISGPTGRSDAQQFFAEECIRQLAAYLAAC